MSALNKIFTVWCEWDIGEGATLYPSKEEAMEAARTLLEASSIEEPFEELFAEGLIGVESLKHG